MKYCCFHGEAFHRFDFIQYGRHAFSCVLVQVTVNTPLVRVKPVQAINRNPDPYSYSYSCLCERSLSSPCRTVKTHNGAYSDGLVHNTKCKNYRLQSANTCGMAQKLKMDWFRMRERYSMTSGTWASAFIMSSFKHVTASGRRPGSDRSTSFSAYLLHTYQPPEHIPLHYLHISNTRSLSTCLARMPTNHRIKFIWKIWQNNASAFILLKMREYEDYHK